MTTVALDRSELVKRAAHCYRSYGASYPGTFWAEVDKLQLTEAEAQEAIAQAKRENEEHYAWCSIYGNPEYGGWRNDKRDGRRKPAAIIPREFQQ